MASYILISIEIGKKCFRDEKYNKLNKFLDGSQTFDSPHGNFVKSLRISEYY